MNGIARWCTGAVLVACVGCGGSNESADHDATGGSSTDGLETGGTPATGGAIGSQTGGGPGVTETGGASTGGREPGAGGAATGGASGGAGATDTGGASTGGREPGAGGAASGGESSGGGAGSDQGGTGAGGLETGGASAGGSNTGGAATGGNDTGGSDTGGAGGTRTFELPVANASFDYQIGEPYSPPAGVTIVSRDRESEPASGLYNICYVNGFQTQSAEESFWLDSHPDLILRDAEGNPVRDENWGEYLVDTGTEAKRTALAAIVGGWIEACADDGFDAVEVDNLDSYSRSEGLLTEDDNVAFVASLSAVAHDAGLAIAQKNSVELLGRVAEMGTDFAVAEECNRWDECGQYQAVYGDRVYVIEYRQQDFDAGCRDFPELAIVLRDMNVTAPASGSYVYEGC